jgi:hypothetical protein
MSDILFAPHADRSAVSAYSLSVLRRIMHTSKVKSLTISSSYRGPQDQARVMLHNIRTHGLAHQSRLYKGKPGETVISIYALEVLNRVGNSQTGVHVKTDVLAGFESQIRAVGGENVSHHGSDPRILNVFDVAPNSIGHGLLKGFIDAAKRDLSVSLLLTPPVDPGIHFEIPQPIMMARRASELSRRRPNQV